MKDRVWTISNALSFLRILLVVPLAFFLLSEKESSHWWAVGIMIVEAVTDILDGILARALHQESEFGKILDPLADKVGIAVVIIILLVRGFLPTWFVVVALIRDGLILGGALYVKTKKTVVLQSNAIGKLTICLIAALILVSTLNLAALELTRIILLAASTVMIAISILVYAQRFYRVVTEG